MGAIGHTSADCAEGACDPGGPDRRDGQDVAEPTERLCPSERGWRKVGPVTPGAMAYQGFAGAVGLKTLPRQRTGWFRRGQ